MGKEGGQSVSKFYRGLNWMTSESKFFNLLRFRHDSYIFCAQYYNEMIKQCNDT